MINPPFKLRNLSFLALLFGNALAAQAASEAYNFNIPAQPASRTLDQISRSSKTQLIYADKNVQGVTTAPVKGQYTAPEALQVALNSTDLAYEKVDNSLITVKKANKKSTATSTTILPQMTVTDTADKTANNVNAPTNKDYYIKDAVTATKTDTPLMQTPMSVKVVPQQVLKDQQVITVDEALRNVSGVVAGAGGTGTFFMRGFGNYNLYRDGFLNQSQWAHTEDLTNVERVEVLKGPGSILYGRTEPGGLVNFVTKSPLNESYYSLRQQFGSYDLYRTNIDATGPLTADKDLAYRFNLGYQTNRNFQEFGGNERLMVAPGLRWNISDKTTSTLKVEYSDIKEKGRGTIPLQGNRPSPIPRYRNLGDSWNLQEDEYVMVSLNTEHQFNDDWKLRHRFNFSNHELTMTGFFPDGSFSPVQDNGDFTRSFFAQNTDGKDYQHNFFNALELTGKFTTGFAKHTLLIGGDYYRSDYRATMAGFGANPNFYDSSNIYNPTHTPNAPTINPEDVSIFTSTLPWFGLYLQDQVELPYNIHLLGGLRYDNAESNSSSSGEFGGGADPRSSSDKVSPRGGLVWQPIPELSLYGSYTQNFGASNFFDGNRRPLPPQTAEQWEVGAKTELFDGRFNATLAYFDLKKTNLPVAIDPLTTKALGKAESRGIEFDLSGELLPGWSVIGGYAYTPFAKTTDNGFETDPITGLSIPSAQNGKRLNNAPKHSGSLWTTYEIQSKYWRGLKFGAGMQGVGQREIGYNETAQAPGYVTMGLMASQLWTVGKSKVTAQLNVDNVLDNNYIASVYSYGPSNYGAPRTFMGSIKIEY
jgi:iron complex outermembrane receptor protein